MSKATKHSAWHNCRACSGKRGGGGRGIKASA